MWYEYDPNKSAANKIKHGIDFEEARKLWLDDYLLEVPSAYEAERRSMFYGKIDDKNWTAVATARGDAIRIISCRRSRKEEVEIYEHRKYHRDIR